LKKEGYRPPSQRGKKKPNHVTGQRRIAYKAARQSGEKGAGEKTFFKRTLEKGDETRCQLQVQSVRRGGGAHNPGKSFRGMEPFHQRQEEPRSRKIRLQYNKLGKRRKRNRGQVLSTVKAAHIRLQ